MPCNKIEGMHDFDLFLGAEIMHTLGFIAKKHA